MFTLGLIVNPVAGLGGSVALKGSDGVAELALKKGAKPKAGDRTKTALKVLLSAKNQIKIITCPGNMGQSIVASMGFDYDVIPDISLENTQASDTKKAALAMQSMGVDLILFAGGDGTARDICSVVLDDFLVLGIPAGVKIHSGVYGVTPQATGEVVKMLLAGEIIDLKPQDVRDIDEDAFRNNQVKAKLFGEMTVPQVGEFVQSVKQGGVEHEALVIDDMAAYIEQEMEPGTLYFVGSGKTTQGVMNYLNLESTLLGVDAVLNEQVIAKDMTEQEILSLLGQYEKSTIILSVIGGQGHVFGRGNQQFSPEVIRKVGRSNIFVLCTKTKLLDLKNSPLRLDTGDESLDLELSGYIEVITGYQDKVLYPIK